MQGFIQKFHYRTIFVDVFLLPLYCHMIIYVVFIKKLLTLVS